MDKMHKYTDEVIADVEKRLNEIYSKVKNDLETEMKRIDTLIARANKVEDKEKRVALLRRKKEVKTRLIKISVDIQEANETAVKILNNENLNVYSENYNFMLYEIQKESGLPIDFTLFDKNTLKSMVKDKEGIFNFLSIESAKDLGVIRRKLESTFYASLIEGMGAYEIAKSLGKVVDMNQNNLVRLTRTLTTRVQNEARFDGMEYGEKLGIKLQKVWIATADGRTRRSHKNLNGEVRAIDEPFSNGLMFPGADGTVSEVANCRCTMTTEFEGFTKTELEKKLDEQVKKVTYEAWKENKK